MSRKESKYQSRTYRDKNGCIEKESVLIKVNIWIKHVSKLSTSNSHEWLQTNMKFLKLRPSVLNWSMHHRLSDPKINRSWPYIHYILKPFWPVYATHDGELHFCFALPLLKSWFTWHTFHSKNTWRLYPKGPYQWMQPSRQTTTGISQNQRSSFLVCRCVYVGACFCVLVHICVHACMCIQKATYRTPFTIRIPMFIFLFTPITLGTSLTSSSFP